MMKYGRSVSCNQLIDSAITQASPFISPVVQYKVIHLVSPPSIIERKTESHSLNTTERKMNGQPTSDHSDRKKNKSDELLERLMYGLKAKVSIF